MSLRERMALLPQQAPFSASQRATWIAQNNKRTRGFKVRLSADVQVTVAGTLVRNGGSVAGLISRIGVQQGSEDVVNLDCRMARHLTEALSASWPFSRRLSVAEVIAKGTFTLVEEIFIPMHAAGTARPPETYFMERNPGNQFQVFIQQAAAPVLTDGTIVVTNLAASVTQIFDERIGSRPKLVPFYDLVELAIPGAAANARVDLRGSAFLQGLIVQQDCSLGEVADIITSLAYRGDGLEIIGPAQVPWDHLVDSMPEMSGASGPSVRFSVAGDTAGVPNFVTAQRSWFWYNHLKNGLLSGLLPPTEAPNLRLEMTVAPTALAGAASSTVRVGRIGFLRDLAVVNPDLGFDIIGT